jgi:molybdopterin/thiamine biosynthesis adenylyltransferase
MKEYFKRQIQLWGVEVQKSLATKKIAIVGCGGLGSSISLALGASGIGEIHFVDFDSVSISNIHRQIAFTLEDNGKNKADINKNLTKKRSNFTKAYSYNMDFIKWSKKDIDVDLIIDATDNLQTRSEINSYAKSKNIAWIYGSVESFVGQVAFIEKSSFNDAFKIVSKDIQGVAAPMVMHIASLQANLAIRYLTNLSIKKDFLYYLFFNNDGELVTQKFALPT